MKMFYTANVRMPTSKAHGIQMVRMCEAFAGLGFEVSFFVPSRSNPITENPFQYYGIKENFSFHSLFSFDVIEHLPRLGFIVQTATFAISVFLRFLFTSRKETVFYTREYYIAFIGKLLGFFVVYEAHRIPEKKKLFFLLLNGVRFIVTNSEGVANEFRKRDFVNVLPFPNGICLTPFNIEKDKLALRESLRLPVDKFLAVYTGHLYEWKGVDVLLAVARAFQDNGHDNIRFICIGGTDGDLDTYRKKIDKLCLKNFELLGHKNPTQIPQYLKAADTLVLPNIPISNESRHYTSPVKLPEYMASGTPILASDLPSIRALLGEDEAFFAEAGEVDDFMKMLLYIFRNPSEAETRAKVARKHVRKWTWENRARAIIQFIHEE